MLFICFLLWYIHFLLGLHVISHLLVDLSDSSLCCALWRNFPILVSTVMSFTTFEFMSTKVLLISSRLSKSTSGFHLSFFGRWLSLLYIFSSSFAVILLLFMSSTTILIFLNGYLSVLLCRSAELIQSHASIIVACFIHDSIKALLASVLCGA
ncbi:hypothetical protein Tco_1304264 [Tanacetum coccineum]